MPRNFSWELSVERIMIDTELEELEIAACNPVPVDPAKFNPNAQIPYDLKPEHIGKAMQDFVDFLGFINQQLRTKDIERIESMLIPANFSGIVSEFMVTRIPRYCKDLAKNTYHNGHPDLIPAGLFPGNSVQHDTRGIEVKASRYPSGWQGHNAEAAWLMVFIFDSNSSSEKVAEPRPFRFVGVVGAQLEEEDWSFSGRSETSRRTITASVRQSGLAKMLANWIYNDGLIRPQRQPKRKKAKLVEPLPLLEADALPLLEAELSEPTIEE
jgi:hypothetical protein